MRVVIALDSFKGSLDAAAACAALAEGWTSARPVDELIRRPMADGGEGTLDAFVAAVPGARRMPVTVDGPHRCAIAASWLLLPDGAGVVELASTSGIELLRGDLRPWDAGTGGFGQAIVAALDHGVERLVLGIGSSASTDGGAGMLAALGGRLTDAAGAPIVPGARGLQMLAAVDLSGVRSLPPGGVIVLTDVTNPLCGPRGAAAVFGPQKGVIRSEVASVDAALARFAGLVAEGVSSPAPAASPASPASQRRARANAPGAGAAGGTGFGLLAWGAELVPGAERVAELIGLAEAIAGADIVVTGEGAFDGSSAAGKAPGFVAQLAADAGVPVALVAGRIAAEADTTRFVASVSLTDLAGSPRASLIDPARWLRAAGEHLSVRRSQD